MTRLITLLITLLLYQHNAIANMAKKLSTPAIPNHAVILLYHHVADDTPAITSTRPQDFSDQLQHIAEQGFQVWPLEKILSHLKNQQTIPDKVVAISFDDSYQSVYDIAYPMLKKRQYPFTIFVTTEAIDKQYNNQTSWPQLAEMAKNGATIANHSRSHKHLLIKEENETEKQWQQRVRADINHAEQRIKQQIGYSKKLFAYPYGEFNQAFETLLAEMDYTGFGQHSGPIGENSNKLAIPRFPIAGNYSDLQSFTEKLLTLPMAARFLPIKTPLAYDDSTTSLRLQALDGSLPIGLQCFASLQGRVAVEYIGSSDLEISIGKPIPLGRSRVNCTAAFSGPRFYWQSQPLIRLQKNDQWIID
ncbi:MAG: peptidoglycan/xylan/chitin deacetylase (PgdA/CDA1 family) [Oceanicoccus sp.]|jgi:peptidoglycan/xylan/chitin deacetylase (PgdA/CDA1 family)